MWWIVDPKCVVYIDDIVLDGAIVTDNVVRSTIRRLRSEATSRTIKIDQALSGLSQREEVLENRLAKLEIIEENENSG